MAFLSIAKVEKIAGSATENLLFYPTDSLTTVVANANGRYSEDCRLKCLAELVTRWYLNPIPDIERCFDAVFPAKEWHTLKQIHNNEIFCAPTATSLPDKLWNATDPFLARGELLARKRLAALLDADGFIPVYLETDAFFLPFHLEQKESLPCIGDIGGCPIQNWIHPYTDLFGPKPTYHCVVHCRQIEELPPLSGHSFMLPLYLATQRKCGNLPQYNKLRLLSTGAISNDHLQAVETEEKMKALPQYFANAYFFFPENARFHSEEYKTVPLNTTLNLQETLEELRNHIEAKGLVVPSFHDAKKRLEQLDYETRHDNQKHWDMLLAQLQTNMEAIPKDRAPEAYLLCLMLKSAIFCHKGHTDKALKINAMAKNEAKSLHAVKQLRRLEIEELVELQDIEDFASIRSLEPALKEDLEQLQDSDLLMRYYGTMGQAHCYGFLAGISGFEANQAKIFLKQALQHAQALNSEQDIAQDLNYLYLWYVLFDPASPEASHAFNQAREHIKRNLQLFPKTQKKNWYFLQRMKLQALYRRLLQGETLPAIDYQAEDLLDEAFFWLRALGKKYLGAIAASHNNKPLAIKYFQDAISLLKNDRADNVIAFILMTVLAEAFHSLQEESYRQDALNILPSLNVKHHNTIKRWQNYLQGKGEYPALKYWY